MGLFIIMEEKKICKACGIEKLFKDFQKNLKMKSGRTNCCKKCISIGNRIKDPNKASAQTQLKWEKMKDTTSKLSPAKPEDYRVLYEFLSVMGYDVNQDVHQQFLDKWNAGVKDKPMKYKKRNGNSLNIYLPNGERNPLHKKYKLLE
jgi:hypothetical protein